MENIKCDKIERVLGIYTKLMKGYLVSKAEEAVNYGVNERSIQRDIDDICNYLEADTEGVGCSNSIIYDRIGKGYHKIQSFFRLPKKLSQHLDLLLDRFL